MIFKFDLLRLIHGEVRQQMDNALQNKCVELSSSDTTIDQHMSHVQILQKELNIENL